MTDYAQARRIMVDCQVRPADVTDLRIIAAMQEMPRERFAPGREAIAYLDADLLVGQGGRALLKPMVFAKLLQAAETKATDRVLDVGCATGYSAAVLGRLAAQVTALEEHTSLPGDALRDIGGPNVTLVTGALAAGWVEDAPYDVIMVEGACEVVPDALLAQLKDGGRLLAVVGSPTIGKAMIYRAGGGRVTAQPLFDAAARALPGFARPKAFVF